MDFYISTSLKSLSITDGGGLIDQLARLGVDGVELDYRIAPEMIPSLKSALTRRNLPVSSVHNFFPEPDIRPRRPGSGDFFNLASLDPDERREAVKWTTRTIEWASEFGARAVVVHCGKIIMDPAIEDLKKAHQEGTLETEGIRLFLAEKLAELNSRKPPHLDALRFVLDPLIRVSERENIILALENRVHYHELPCPDDFEKLFIEFSGAPIGYWHDTGHDHVMNELNLFPAGRLLQKYGSHLIGIHIHDAVGLKDHLPPAAGEIDFSQVAAHLAPPVKGVFEFKPGTPDQAVSKAMAWFREYISRIDIP